VLTKDKVTHCSSAVEKPLLVLAGTIILADE